MGMLRGFHPCHIGTLDLLWILLWIFWLNFLEAVFRWQKLPLLQKNTHRKFGEKFGGKIRWKHSIFRCVFRRVFRYVFRYVFRWATFSFEIGKIRAESVLQESRGQKLNPNLFFSNFSGASGISRQNPGISRQKSLIPWVSRDISNFLAPTPSRGRPPPHPKISGPKSLGVPA